jgi:hypothetical protein
MVVQYPFGFKRYSIFVPYLNTIVTTRYLGKFNNKSTLSHSTYPGHAFTRLWCGKDTESLFKGISK